MATYRIIFKSSLRCSDGTVLESRVIRRTAAASVEDAIEQTEWELKEDIYADAELTLISAREVPELLW